MSVSLRRTRGPARGLGADLGSPHSLRRPFEEEDRCLRVSRRGEEARAPPAARPPQPAGWPGPKSTPRTQSALGCPRAQTLAGQPQAVNSL